MHSEANANKSSALQSEIFTSVYYLTQSTVEIPKTSLTWRRILWPFSDVWAYLLAEFFDSQ